MPTRSTQHGPHTSSVVQMLTDSVATNPVRSRAAGRLEPCAGKLACTVLRGEHAGNGVLLPDGKARKPYEFGVKVSLAVTHRQGLMVGARSFPGNPYDGNTLAEQIEQTTALLQDIGIKPTTAVVDLGFRGEQAAAAPVELIHRGKYKRLTDTQRRWLKRRQAIEPAIGHTKQDNGMARCWLKGSEGDALHAVLCAAGFNVRWLLRAIVRLGVGAFLCALNFAGWYLGISLLRASLAIPERYEMAGTRSASTTSRSRFVPATAG